MDSLSPHFYSRNPVTFTYTGGEDGRSEFSVEKDEVGNTVLTRENKKSKVQVISPVPVPLHCLDGIKECFITSLPKYHEEGNRESLMTTRIEVFPDTSVMKTKTWVGESKIYYEHSFVRPKKC